MKWCGVRLYVPHFCSLVADLRVLLEERVVGREFIISDSKREFYATNLLPICMCASHFSFYRVSLIYAA